MGATASSSAESKGPGSNLGRDTRAKPLLEVVAPIWAVVVARFCARASRSWIHQPSVSRGTRPHTARPHSGHAHWCASMRCLQTEHARSAPHAGQCWSRGSSPRFDTQRGQMSTPDRRTRQRCSNRSRTMIDGIQSPTTAQIMLQKSTFRLAVDESRNKPTRTKVNTPHTAKAPSEMTVRR